MREPVWIEEDLVLAIHDRQLAEHGGAEGVRDVPLLLSALAAQGCAPGSSQQVVSPVTHPVVPSSTTVKLELRVSAVGKGTIGR